MRDLKGVIMLDIAVDILGVIQPGETVTEREIKERIERHSHGVVSKALREMLQRGELLR